MKAEAEKQTLKEKIIVLMEFFGIMLILGLFIYSIFLRFTMDANKSEARSNLISIRRVQEAYFKKFGVYVGASDDECFKLLNWEPGAPEETVYSYYCGGDKIESGRFPDECQDPPSIMASTTGFTMIAVGNLDRDADCDVWYINDTGLEWEMKMLGDGTIVEGSDTDKIPLLDRVRPPKLKRRKEP